MSVRLYLALDVNIRVSVSLTHNHAAAVYVNTCDRTLLLGVPECVSVGTARLGKKVL